MPYIRRFILILTFFTRIPVPIKFEIHDDDLSKGSIFIPLAGLIVGGFSALGLLIGSLLPYRFFPALLAITMQLIITGALHLDGLGDTFDGLLSNKPRERMLEIMRDSRLGTNAVTAILISILLKFFMLYELYTRFSGMTGILLTAVMPAAGKVGILTSAAMSSYARVGQGLGKGFIDMVGLKQWLGGMVISSAVFLLMFGPYGIIFTVLPVLTAFIATKLIHMKIGGMTGDTLGASNELCELVYLVFCYPVALHLL